MCQTSPALLIIFMITALTTFADQRSFQADHDLQTIQERMVADLLPVNDLEKRKIEASTRISLDKLKPDGSWPDQDYKDVDNEHWKCRQHLPRLLEMAVAYRSTKKFKNNDELRAKILLAYGFWIKSDPQNKNWWVNQIGVPQHIGKILLLMGDELSPQLKTKGIEIMRRSVWNVKPWTGQNLVWGTTIQIVRGCLEMNETTVDEGFSRMWKEVKIAPPGKDGIQSDQSFHQHGQVLYSGGYGLAFCRDCSRYLRYSNKTRFAAPQNVVETLVNYLLDGQQWMVKGDNFNYSATGRGVTRKGNSSLGITASLHDLADIQSARKEEIADFLKRLEGGRDAPLFEGNKHFWMSDFMSHVRKEYATSVKMYSSRTHNNDGNHNGENKKSHHFSDGATFIFRTGQEYNDIFAIWDWLRIPGTTIEQNTPLIPNEVSQKGTRPFVGGVCDGRYGCAAMDLAVGKLSAKKSWFYFDRQFVCLGTDINCPTDHQVVTSINQCWPKETLTSNDIKPSPSSFQSQKESWIWNDGIAYIIPENQNVLFSTEKQKGRWSDIGTGPEQEISENIFNLALDHGHKVIAGKYEYIVAPDVLTPTSENILKLASEIKIVSNNSSHQAVRNKALNMLQIVFWDTTPFYDNVFGKITVDKPCLVLIKRTDDLQVTVSNPENKPVVISLEVDSDKLQFDLPSGPDAGKSITKTLHQ